MKEIFSNAIRYWEKKRIFYNLGLLVIVIIYFIKHLPKSLDTITFDWMLIFFVLAVLANVCYSFAYIVDIYLQFSEFSESWKKRRWILFVIGLSLAAVITRFFAMDMFI
ncbi:hypothetical protein JXB12_02080 [candidate division KSB1 bacterium]|nr:hypothetical protein [candidate division KSB1 bacterium]